MQEKQGTLFPPGIKEVEIIYKAPKLKDTSQVQSSRDCFKIFKAMSDPRKIDFKEFFYVALLNRSNYVIGVSLIGIGCTTGVTVSLKEILQLVIKTNASAVAICHNHPSGSLIPSEADNQITKRVKEACHLVDVTLIDHLIITSGTNYYSYNDEGQI